MNDTEHQDYMEARRQGFDHSSRHTTGTYDTTDTTTTTGTVTQTDTTGVAAAFAQQAPRYAGGYRCIIADQNKKAKPESKIN